MTRTRHSLPGYVFCLVLALTGYQMAAARAQPVPVGQMVICTGLGLVTVMVDAQGQPTGESHVCPDGLATLFVAAGAACEPKQPSRLWVSLALRPAQAAGQGRRPPQGRARGPPTLV